MNLTKASRETLARALIVAVALALLGQLASGCGLLGPSTGVRVQTPAPLPVPSPGTRTSTETTGGHNVKTIYFAGGCFWGLQKYLDQIDGVNATEVGYANGASNSATYGDGSGYAEAVRVDYDPTVAPLPFLLREFYKSIDPTTLNRQGPDVGTDYRSGVYFVDQADQHVIAASLAELQKQYSAKIAIELGPLHHYARAEDYHQKYLDKNPGGYCHIPISAFKDAAAARPTPQDFEASK